MTIPGRYIDTIMEALYDSFSGPAGQNRHWDKLNDLFIADAQILRADLQENGCSQSAQMNIREFTESIEGFIDKKGFYGREIARRTEMFHGNLAKVLSVYEGRFALDDVEPFRKGTTKIRLYNDGRRWWIVNMLLREYRTDDLSLGAYGTLKGEPV